MPTLDLRHAAVARQFNPLRCRPTRPAAPVSNTRMSSPSFWQGLVFRFRQK